MAELIRAGCSDWNPRRGNQCSGHGVRRRAARHVSSIGHDNLRHVLSRPRNYRQWPGEESFDQSPKGLTFYRLSILSPRRVVIRGLRGCTPKIQSIERIRHMNNERVAQGPFFRIEYLLNCHGIQRVTSKPVHGFGREGDQAPIA